MKSPITDGIAVDFATDLTRGACPLRVAFSNRTILPAEPQPQPAPAAQFAAMGAAPIPPAGVTWRWDFGDGATSDQKNPAHLYQSPGVYTVRLIYVDKNGNSRSCTKPGLISVVRQDASLAAALILQNRNMIAGKTANVDGCDLFAVPDPSCLDRNPLCWAAGVDWSCIPARGLWDGIGLGVLVAPDVLIQANHLHAYGTLTFVGRNGEQESAATVAGLQVGDGDIFVAKLDRELPSWIKPAAAMSSAAYGRISEADLAAKRVPAAFTNQWRQLRIGMLGALSKLTVLYRPTDAAFAPWYQPAYNGDSGSGVFLVLDNQPILLGTLLGSDYDNYAIAQSVGDRVADINSAMKAVGSRHALTLFDFGGFKG